ncbi:beta-lactamase family protein [Verrucomicrobia bacterium]|nr:beta-lactamase family protein [Verrucomicrobiota bacterium]
MVFQNGKTIYRHTQNSGKKGDKDIQKDTIFPMYSMTKPITIAGMLLLKERGLVAWDDPVSKYIPYFKNLRYKKDGKILPCQNELKVIHLMTHKSGYRYYGNPLLENFGSGAGGASFEEPQPNQIKYDNLDAFVKDVASQPLEFEPGTQYQYGISQAVLGRLIEVISGKSLYTYLKESLFDPLEMANTKFHLTRDEWERYQVLYINADNLKGFTYLLDSHMTFKEENKAHFGGEGLLSTFDDYSHFCEMLLSRGIYRGKRILSESSIEQMTGKWVDLTEIPESDDKHELGGCHYGLACYVLNTPVLDRGDSEKGMFGWAGYNNTHYWIEPQKKLFGLFMTRSREFGWDIPIALRKTVNSIVE